MNTKTSNFLPIRLRMLRLNSGMSQEVFASKIGISRGALANYESGKRHPGSDVLKKAAFLCQISEDYFYRNVTSHHAVFRETEEEKIKKYKQLMKGRGNETFLNISSLSMEHKYCVVEYYDYILSLNRENSEESFQ